MRSIIPAKKNPKYRLLWLGLVIAGNLCFSDSGFTMPNNPVPGMGTISGTVISANSSEPIEYAAVVVYALPDSSMITGTTTNSKGKFRFVDIPFGQYFIQIKFVGFKTYYSKSFELSEENENHKLEKISLSPAEYLLEGIDVVADKSLIEYKIDKKIVNVSQDIMAAGGTAVDVLENTPSVEVDIEGNVSLRGSSDFTVLIDGRPTALSGSDALQQIPSSSIESIEIITNPSAKYDAEGTAGIINVITRKKKESGLNGQIDATAGTGDKYEGNILLNYKTKKISYIAGLEYRNQYYPGERNTSRETYQNDTTFFLEQEGRRDRIRKSVLGRLGFDWNLTRMAVVSVDLRMGQFNSGWDSKTKSKEWSLPGSVQPAYTLNEEESPRISDFFSAVLSYSQKLDTLGQKIDINAFYAAREGDDEEITKEWVTDAAWNKSGNPDTYTNSKELENAAETQVKIDYTKPFSNQSTLETGLFFDRQEDTEKYSFSQVPFSTEVSDYSNSMDFHRDVLAGYFTYANTLLGIQYKLGVRGEYTFRKTTDNQNNKNFKIERPDYFPSLHLSRKLNKYHQLYASYSRRIDRPDSRQLEPFTYYIDANNRWRGNPELEPEYINSFELGWLKKWDNSYLSIEAYYKNTNNLITRILEVSEKDIIIHTYENLSEDHSLGGEAMINLTALKWLSLNLMGSVYYYRLKGEINNTPVDNSSTNWNSRLNARVKITGSTRLELRASYRGPTVTAQGIREGSFGSDFGARQDLFNRSLSLTLQVRDIFGTMIYDFTSEEAGVFYEHTTFTRESQIILLTATFRFNSFKLKKEESALNGDDPGLDISY